MTRAGGLLWIAAMFVASAAAVGWSNSDNVNPHAGSADTGPVPGNGTVTKATPAASGPQFAVPLDATPNPDGSQVFLTAVDSATGPQVFKVSAAGGANAAPISNGTLYFIDASSSAGKIIKVAAGGTTGTALGGGAASLNVSYPGGLAASQDGSALLVAVFDPATGGESIARVDTSSGAVTQNPLGLTANREPGGLHRASNADVYSFVDTGAGATSSGTIYVLSK